MQGKSARNRKEGRAPQQKKQYDARKEHVNQGRQDREWDVGGQQCGRLKRGLRDIQAYCV